MVKTADELFFWNCSRLLFRTLAFFLTLQAYLMHDKRKCTVFSLQGLNHTASLLCCPAPNVYMVLQPLGVAGVTETWLFLLVKSIPALWGDPGRKVNFQPV